MTQGRFEPNDSSKMIKCRAKYKSNSSIRATNKFELRHQPTDNISESVLANFKRSKRVTLKSFMKMHGISSNMALDLNSKRKMRPKNEKPRRKLTIPIKDGNSSTVRFD